MKRQTQQATRLNTITCICNKTSKAGEKKILKQFTHSSLSPAERAILSQNSNDYNLSPEYETIIQISDWDTRTLLEKIAIKTQLEALGWVEVA